MGNAGLPRNRYRQLLEDTADINNTKIDTFPLSWFLWPF